MEPLRPEAYSAHAQPVRRRSACFPRRGARRTLSRADPRGPGSRERPASSRPGVAAERDQQERRARSAGRLATAEFDQPDQVLWALLDNAVKYGSHGEVEVEVATDEAGGRLRLAVIDHGPGVSETDRARLFGRFEREGGQPGDDGSGLGLYVSRELRARDGRRVQRGGPYRSGAGRLGRAENARVRPATVPTARSESAGGPVTFAARTSGGGRS